jgi:hypothetical protein
VNDTQTLDAVRHCKGILCNERQYNSEHNIWPSVNVVIDRMLERELELKDLYCELYSKLASIPHGIRTFLDAVLAVAALWQPTAISEQRASRQRLLEINKLIAERADQLAKLMRERDVLSNDSGFSADSHYHIVDVMEEAAENNSLYGIWLKKPIKQLQGEFGLKYWPKIYDVVHTLAVDSQRATVEASDPITEAATSAKRASKSDFVRALYVALSERSERENDRLPNEFKLSDNSTASLVNCLLNLDHDDVVDSAYVKRFRQRGRQAVLSECPAI